MQSKVTIRRADEKREPKKVRFRDMAPGTYFKNQLTGAWLLCSKIDAESYAVFNNDGRITVARDPYNESPQYVLDVEIIWREQE